MVYKLFYQYMLHYELQVSQEFDRITGLTDSMVNFTTNWQNSWIEAIKVVSKEEGLLTITDDSDGSYYHI